MYLKKIKHFGMNSKYRLVDFSMYIYCIRDIFILLLLLSKLEMGCQDECLRKQKVSSYNESFVISCASVNVPCCLAPSCKLFSLRYTCEEMLFPELDSSVLYLML